VCSLGLHDDLGQANKSKQKQTKANKNKTAKSNEIRRNTHNQVCVC
jgi:hypothetical protein